MNAEYWIEKLNLEYHQETNLFYKVKYISQEEINFNCGYRPLATSVYFLLTEKQFLPFHHMIHEQICHYYTGNTNLKIYYPEKGRPEIKSVLLGTHSNSSDPVVIIKPYQSYAVELENKMKSRFALLGVTFIPGFEPRDIEWNDRETMIMHYPAYSKLIMKLTRTPTVS